MNLDLPPAPRTGACVLRDDAAPPSSPASGLPDAQLSARLRHPRNKGARTHRRLPAQHRDRMQEWNGGNCAQNIQDGPRSAGRFVGVTVDSSIVTDATLGNSIQNHQPVRIDRTRRPPSPRLWLFAGGLRRTGGDSADLRRRRSENQVRGRRVRILGRGAHQSEFLRWPADLGIRLQRNGSTAIAAHDVKESVPGAQWGNGAEVALVRGPPSELPVPNTLAVTRLVELSSGNAHLIRVGVRLNGEVASFGDVFWKLLTEEAPLTVAAIRTQKIHSVTYTDRYLLTPLSLRLLFEVVRKMPGSAATNLCVSTARLSRPERRGWTVFHPFADDAARRAVLQALLPNAQIDIRGKPDLPHARSFTLRLGDDRNITILLDQGFGAWRALRALKHDFSADPAKQARLLRSMNFEIGVEPEFEVPIVLEER